jgi:uncharacterized membrane protein
MIVSVAVCFLCVSYLNSSDYFEIAISRKFIVFSFSFSIVYIIVGIELLKEFNTPIFLRVLSQTIIIYIKAVSYYVVML